MRILGIETSCDETAAAVIEYFPDSDSPIKILSSVIASSIEIHKTTGGIIPENAARKQVEYIIPVIEKALVEASRNISLKVHSSHRAKSLRDDKVDLNSLSTLSKLNDEKYDIQDLISSIDAIAVTYGPGLIGSLLVGVETAKTLARVWNKPLVPVNHLVAHIYANFITQNSKLEILNPKGNLINSTKDSLPSFPALALVVSGGHTDLVLVKSHGEIEWIGGTRDDAAGEAFDKCARILGLPYPGGPSISKEADRYLNQKSEIQNPKLDLFPRPMIYEKNFEWSFSGLKTSVANHVKENEDIDVSCCSANIQEAIVDVLIEKSISAIKKYKPKSFLLSGGVATNKRLGEKYKERITEENLAVALHIPEPRNCTDNALAIAVCARYNFKICKWGDVLTNPELTIND